MQKATINSTSNHTAFILIAFVYVLCFWVTAAHGRQAPVAPAFEQGTTLSSNAGHMRLSWQGNANTPTLVYELQQSTDASFNNPNTLYSGTDAATFVSGLPNGAYYYRVRAKTETHTSPWSATLTLTVQHHSLQLTYTLLCLGGIVFLLTAGLVIHGSRKQT